MDRKSDLTTGGILQKLIFVALPIMGTQLMQMLYNLTDMFWLGRLSSDDVAASGASGMFMWLGFSLLMFGRMGAEIGVSQNKGRGDMDTAAAFAQNALFLALVSGLLYGTVLLAFSTPLIAVYDIRETHVAEASVSYLRIIGLGIPAQFMSAAITGAFNGSGNSRVPFYANAVGLIANMILDPLMIFLLGWGIRGAAVATILAQWSVFLLLLSAIKKHKDRPFRQFSLSLTPNRYKLMQIIRWAAPISVESALFTLLTMMVTRLVASYGADALAVNRVSTQIESLSWLVGGGFGSAVTAFMGQNFGAGRWDRIRSGFRISTCTMLVWGIVVTFALYYGGFALTGLFLQELRLKEMGAVYLKILALCQVVACLEGIGMGYFRGVGRTLLPSGISAASNILRVPLSYRLAATSLGLHGAWWGIAVSAGLRGAVVFGWAAAALAKKTATADGRQSTGE